MGKGTPLKFHTLFHLLVGLLFFAPLWHGQGAVYLVNTTSDAVMVNACENGLANCSLRGAIQAANNHPGADEIEIDLGAGSIINLTGGLPDITESVSVTGLGSDKLTVRRNSGGDYRIFNVMAAGAVTFSGLTIKNGSTPFRGGGIQNSNASGTVTVNNCVLSENSAFDGGGGIYNSTGTMNVTNSTLSGNFGLGNAGGAILNHSGTLTITNSTLSENGSTTGGGIENFGDSATVNMANSTLSGNFTDGNGGGIDLGFGTATVNVVNSTISNNTAGAGGGGIHHYEGTTNITNCTISNNMAIGGGAGVRYEAGMIQVKSTIITLNSTIRGPDVLGTFTSAGFNLIGKTDGSIGFTAPTDHTGTSNSPVDPKLDPNGLQDNGGPTKTVALLEGSPAIDKGSSKSLTANLTTDQRGSGFARTFDNPSIPNVADGDGTDIGAYEVQASSATPGPSKLGNLSTRGLVGTDNNVMIGGFIAVGSAPIKIVVRALGPTLTNFGIAKPLANPTLELRDSNGALILANDNWKDSQQAEIAATGLQPSSDLESAIVSTLPPANYTVIVRGKKNTSGKALLEVYQVD